MPYLLSYFIVMLTNIQRFFTNIAISFGIIAHIWALIAIYSFVEHGREGAEYIYWVKKIKYNLIVILFIALAVLTPDTKQVFQIVGLKSGADIILSDKTKNISGESFEKMYDIFNKTLDDKLLSLGVKADK